jgi:hypothetical protein
MWKELHTEVDNVQDAGIATPLYLMAKAVRVELMKLKIALRIYGAINIPSIL